MRFKKQKAAGEAAVVRAQKATEREGRENAMKAKKTAFDDFTTQDGTLKTEIDNLKNEIAGLSGEAKQAK